MPILLSESYTPPQGFQSTSPSIRNVFTSNNAVLLPDISHSLEFERVATKACKTIGPGWKIFCSKFLVSVMLFHSAHVIYYHLTMSAYRSRIFHL